ncbi:MAG: 50S ribosomal protein L30 [Myxococcales bacterium]|nr:50S ribosomal protein L30 [Myxococcales bacterium]
MGLKIKLVKSYAGASERQLRMIRGLGLRKLGQERLLKDTPAIRGMVFHVQHLVRQEVVAQEPNARKRIKPRRVRERDAKRAEAAR